MASLNARREALLAERIGLLADTSAHSVPAPAPGRLSPDEKVALFLRLFGARADVFARRWKNVSTGRAGYAPACRHEWAHAARHAPRIYDHHEPALPVSARMRSRRLSALRRLGYVEDATAETATETPRLDFTTPSTARGAGTRGGAPRTGPAEATNAGS